VNLQIYLFVLNLITKTCPWLRCFREPKNSSTKILKPDALCPWTKIIVYNSLAKPYMLQNKKNYQWKLESITHTTSTNLSIENLDKLPIPLEQKLWIETSSKLPTTYFMLTMFKYPCQKRK
jgi:hypothetical protein